MRTFSLAALIACLLLSNIALDAKNRVKNGKPVSTTDSIQPNLLNWYNKDASEDQIFGASVEKFYKLMNGKKAQKKIVVAVIDAGVDIKHEDLKGKIWTNTKEIPGNGIDDDKNGYIDDVHGWNFIGARNGNNINGENTEYVRLFRLYKPLFKGINPKKLRPDQKAKYETYLRCKALYEKERNKYQQRENSLNRVASLIITNEATLKSFLKKKTVTQADLENIPANAPEKVIQAKNYMAKMYKRGFSHASFKDVRERTEFQLDTVLNLNFEARSKIIGDNIDDLNDLDYGNNNVTGPKSDHGTHVAGIIAACRNNQLGIDGIAENVEIMPIRTIPHGDEYDKDVALAIRYAVDNGAQIVNMSFGKDFSPQKHMVDEAIKYAESKNVLLIHAAGNSGINIDKDIRYPDKRLDDGHEANNWICVGANASKNDLRFIGVFSNYGKGSVDLFAPGVDVVSLLPGNKYQAMSGTSMACPVVSGVAALIWSYYPELSMQQLKDIILQSSVQYKKLKVYKPDLKNPSKKTKTKFSKLSATGGLVNACKAMEMAEEVLK